MDESERGNYDDLHGKTRYIRCLSLISYIVSFSAGSFSGKFPIGGRPPLDGRLFLDARPLLGPWLFVDSLRKGLNSFV